MVRELTNKKKVNLNREIGCEHYSGCSYGTSTHLTFVRDERRINKVRISSIFFFKYKIIIFELGTLRYNYGLEKKLSAYHRTPRGTRSLLLLVKSSGPWAAFCSFVIPSCYTCVCVVVRFCKTTCRTEAKLILMTLVHYINIIYIYIMGN